MNFGSNGLASARSLRRGIHGSLVHGPMRLEAVWRRCESAAAPLAGAYAGGRIGALLVTNSAS